MHLKFDSVLFCFLSYRFVWHLLHYFVFCVLAALWWWWWCTTLAAARSIYSSIKNKHHTNTFVHLMCNHFRRKFIWMKSLIFDSRRNGLPNRSPKTMFKVHRTGANGICTHTHTHAQTNKHINAKPNRKHQRWLSKGKRWLFKIKLMKWLGMNDQNALRWRQRDGGSRSACRVHHDAMDVEKHPMVTGTGYNVILTAANEHTRNKDNEI